MGIMLDANVQACRSHRRRHHRIPILNRVENEIERFKNNWVQEEDVSM